MGDGTGTITDADALAAVKRQARRVQWKSALSALVLTALYVIVS